MKGQTTIKARARQDKKRKETEANSNRAYHRWQFSFKTLIRLLPPFSQEPFILPTAIKFDATTIILYSTRKRLEQYGWSFCS
mmetsp:Transcript_13393/g.37711  ORF Transcript_13393/g.37711 Transcript_13393/m.37711 type:complete len:82 (+) Transcript_13393:650-895(+)